MSQLTPVSGERDVLVFTDVTLASVDPSPVGAIRGLLMEIGPAAMSMASPATGSSQSVAWEHFAGVRCGGSGVMPDGAEAVEVTAEVAGRRLRWLIPASQLPAWQAPTIEQLLRRRVLEAIASATAEAARTQVTDAGVTDAGVTDAEVTDAGATDAELIDAGVTDAGVASGPAAELAATGPVSAEVAPGPVTAALPPAPGVDEVRDTGPPANGSGPRRPAGPRHAAREPSDLVGDESGPRTAGSNGAGTGTTLVSSPTPRHAAPEVADSFVAALPTATPGDGATWLLEPVPVTDEVHPRGPGRRLLAGLAVAEVLLVVAAVVIPFAADAGSSASGPPKAGDRELARAMNLQQADVPAGWTLDTAIDGPLSGFLTPSTGSGPPTAAERQLAATVAAGFEKCMGIPAPRDRIFGASGSTPTATVSSPAFAAPPGSAGTSAQEAGSTVELFGSAAVVAKDVALIVKPTFPSCFGTAVGASFVGAAATTGLAGELGTPVVAPMSVPAHRAVRTAAVDVTIPVTRQGTTASVEFGIVLIGGGRAEATLYTFSEGAPFPAALTSSLALALSRNVANESTGTAT